uniref:Uncharacterized protein n=1 Tax=Trichuris muris TaxID=70415 RepID=A0A5S6QRN7_TRIMR
MHAIEEWWCINALALLVGMMAIVALLFTCLDDDDDDDDSESAIAPHRHHKRKKKTRRKGKKKKKVKRWYFPKLTTVVRPKQQNEALEAAMDQSKLATGAGVPSLMPLEQQAKSTKQKPDKAAADDKDYGTLKGQIKPCKYFPSTFPGEDYFSIVKELRDNVCEPCKFSSAKVQMPKAVIDAPAGYCLVCCTIRQSRRTSKADPTTDGRLRWLSHRIRFV